MLGTFWLPPMEGLETTVMQLLRKNRIRKKVDNFPTVAIFFAIKRPLIILPTELLLQLLFLLDEQKTPSHPVVTSLIKS